MKKSFTLFVLSNFFLCLFLASTCIAQEKKPNISSKEPPITTIGAEIPKFESDEIYELNPTPDDSSLSKVYIPVDLENSFVELNKMLHPKFVEKLKKGGDDEAINQHFGLGMWVRNNWGLWSGSRLAKYFNNIGIFHPDDMSGIILTSFQRHLKDEPLEIEKQVKSYKEYWEKMERNNPKQKKRKVKSLKSKL